MDDEFEIEVDMGSSVALQWVEEDEDEKVLLMMVADDIEDEGVFFHFDRETAFSMYEFLKEEFGKRTKH